MLWLDSAVIFLLLVANTFGYEQLTLSSLKKFAQLDTTRLSLDEKDDKNHFKHFNRTRTPGSEGSLLIQNYIISHFNALNTHTSVKWEVETDNFQSNEFNFTNVVAKKSPPGLESVKYLVLAAHYDTLIKPTGFIGAIDSAISCGILLDVAETVSSILDIAFEQEENDLGLKLVFFDGEEAITQWSPTDSIYGSRNLHSKWAETGELEQIELFVLLDLLGANDINYIPSYYPNTHDNYNDLSHLESRLKQFSPELFNTSSNFFGPENNVFPAEVNGYIEDDHIPFLRSGVPILHLIPHIFPNIWHKIEDNFNNVDIFAIKRWNTLIRLFVLEYLDIDEF